MPTEQWELLKVFSNRVEADRVAAFLESSKIPVYVDHGALGVGLEGEVKVFVATADAERARWLTSLPNVTDAELDAQSVGQAPKSVE